MCYLDAMCSVSGMTNRSTGRYQSVEQRQFLAERFQANRAHLRSVGYRMLGSMSDADDAVQETWLRLSRAETSGVENLTGWLTTVIARVSLDMPRSRTSRREEQFGDPCRSRRPGTRKALIQSTRRCWLTPSAWRLW
jgi:DNA-directed RNA polymerase specialized sigma24 family protein